MIKSQKKDCIMYKINARIFQLILKYQKKNTKNILMLEKIKNKLNEIKKMNEWVILNLKEDNIFLSFHVDKKHILIPFLNDKDHYITIEEINNYSILEFSELKFSSKALLGVENIINIENENTKNVEKEGNKIFNMNTISEQEAWDFCEKVCDWSFFFNI